LIALHAPLAAPVLASFVVGAFVSVLCAILLCRRYFGAPAVAATAAVAAAPAVAVPHVLSTPPTPSASPLSWRERYYSSFNIKKNVYAIFVFSLLVALLSNADVLLVKSMTSPELTGFYGALRTLGALILTFNLVIVGVVLPAACAEGHDRKSLNTRIVLFAYAGIFLISAVGTALFALFPGFLMGLFLGPQYVAVASALWLFGPLVFFLSVLTMEANFAYARHDYLVCVFLLLALAAMFGGIAVWHATITEVALAMTASLALGWASIFLFNFARRRGQILEVTVPEGV
jgi:O-antigen/teichoic acid export membrane protein